jgi:hypothetical protein
MIKTIYSLGTSVLHEAHDVTYQKKAFFIITAVNTSNLKYFLIPDLTQISAYMGHHQVTLDEIHT